MDIWISKWAKQIATIGAHTLSREWGSALNEYSWEILSAACDKAGSRFEWAPSIKEFKDICVELTKAGVAVDERAQYEAKMIARERDALRRKILQLVKKIYFSESFSSEPNFKMYRIIEVCAKSSKMVSDLIAGDESFGNLKRIIADLEGIIGVNGA